MSLVYNNSTGLYSVSGSFAGNSPLNTSSLVTLTDAQTLTNKTIDCNANSLLNIPASITLPAGMIVPYVAITAPSGWLLCYGQAVSRTTYSALYTVISTSYGTGDGSTTFNIPDLRGRFLAGKDDMGGTAASRLTNAATGGITGSTLGATGGEQAHTLTIAEMPSHNHTPQTANFAGSTYNVYSSAGQANTVAGNSSPPTTNTGGGGSHNVVPPAIVVTYIIKT